MAVKLEKNYSKLTSFGLTPNQAKTYLALIRLGESTAKKVWTHTEIPREEVYRKLNELEELGFVEKTLSFPRIFKALQLKFVLESLLHKKAEELSQMQETAEELLESQKINRSPDASQEDFKINIIPKQKAHIEKAKEEMQKLTKTLDCVLSWEKGFGWFSAHKNIFADLLRRKVKIRWVIERKDNRDLISLLKKLPHSSLFMVKETSIQPEACLGIYDGKVLLLDTSAVSGFIKTPMLWTNNPSLIVLAQSYFDTMWDIHK